MSSSPIAHLFVEIAQRLGLALEDCDRQTRRKTDEALA